MSTTACCSGVLSDFLVAPSIERRNGTPLSMQHTTTSALMSLTTLLMRSTNIASMSLEV